MKLVRIFSVAPALIVALLVAPAHAQLINTSPDHSLTKEATVQYLFPEQVHLKPGQATPVDLHFRVASGLHINSHKPHQDYLIPTTFSIPASSAVRLDSASYPAGADITLPLDPKTKLNVYTGDFIVHARLVTTPGNHLVQAKLHFQACNMSQCLPPQTVIAAFDVIGK
jgi:Thiol:disulfide interchange protein DsbD, N-terminal